MSTNGYFGFPIEEVQIGKTYLLGELVEFTDDVLLKFLKHNEFSVIKGSKKFHIGYDIVRDDGKDPKNIVIKIKYLTSEAL